jgi:predicted subunit of tRNA(5-methylaminomethyl-2-thiouridylate) methyltransferase
MTKKISLMYSGGLDSTMTALELGKLYDEVHLLTFRRGYGHWFVKWSHTRVDEMNKHFGKDIYRQIMGSSKALFKKIVIDPLGKDFIKYKGLFVVCVGCKLAMHAMSVIYNLENNIKYVSDGSSKETDWMADQMKVTLEQYRLLHEKFGLVYSNPVYNYGTREKEREKIAEAKLSTGKRFGDRDYGTQPLCIYGDFLTIIRETLKFGSPIDQNNIVKYAQDKQSLLVDYIHDYFKKKNMNIDELIERVKASD